MKKLSLWLEDYAGLSPQVQENIGISILVIFVLWLLHFLVLKIIFKKVIDVKERYYWRNGVNYIVVIFGMLLLLVVWVESYGSLGTFLGLLSAGLAIALRDPIVNFFGWIFIIIRRPFQVGDRLQIGPHAGDVIDIRIFQFTLNEIGNWVDADQSTGRIIHIPNGQVFTTPQANYTRGFSYIWNEISIIITFQSDWKLAKQMLQEIAEKHAAHLSEGAQKKLIEASRRYMIFYNKLTPIVYTSVKEYGIRLTIRYLCRPQRRRNSEQAMWEEILNAFTAHQKIQISYPTQRIHFDYKDMENYAEKFNKSGRSDIKE